jgi:hypothetical protein
VEKKKKQCSPNDGRKWWKEKNYSIILKEREMKNLKSIVHPFQWKIRLEKEKHIVHISHLIT